MPAFSWPQNLWKCKCREWVQESRSAKESKCSDWEPKQRSLSSFFFVLVLFWFFFVFTVADWFSIMWAQASERRSLSPSPALNATVCLCLCMCVCIERTANSKNFQLRTIFQSKWHRKKNIHKRGDVAVSADRGSRCEEAEAAQRGVCVCVCLRGMLTHTNTHIHTHAYIYAHMRIKKKKKKKAE